VGIKQKHINTNDRRLYDEKLQTNFSATHYCLKLIFQKRVTEETVLNVRDCN